MDTKAVTPILFPIEPSAFWEQLRKIVREELKALDSAKSSVGDFETPGFTEKPLYKIQEICSLFNITKPTIYEWIKHGKLKRVKIRSRVYFLGSDIKQLMQDA